MQKFDVQNISDEDIINGKKLLIDKPINWTSFDVVKYIRKSLTNRFKVKKIKVGHAGTLDPLATGLLIICIGKETKNITKYQNLKKTYIGKFKLGETTPSFDSETEVNKTYEYVNITESDVKTVSKEFIGKSMQTPPIFSALKKNGKRMYEYARENLEVEIDEREIEIDEFRITEFKTPVVNFEITCSKGTYIRSIANDFGKKLNSGSYLFELRRVNIGDYSVLNAYNIQ